MYKSGFISTLIDVNTSEILSIKLSNSQDERLLFIEQLKEINKDQQIVFIFDAGYYSEKMIKVLDEYKFNYIFRMKKGTVCEKELSDDNNDIIYNSTKKTDKIYDQKRFIYYKLTKSKELCKKRGKNLENMEDYYLLTSLVDKNEYQTLDFKDIYHQRWDVETHFRQLKYISSLGQINIRSIKKLDKCIAILMFVHTLVAFLEQLIENTLELNKNKKINKKIMIEAVTYKFFQLILNGKLTPTKLKTIFNLFKLVLKFLMPIQNNRHYRRQRKIVINSWGDHSFYNK